MRRLIVGHWLTFACAVGLTCVSTAPAPAVVIVRTNIDKSDSATPETEDASYVFTNLAPGDQPVPALSAVDLANGIAPVLVSGTPHGASGAPAVLTDGLGASGVDVPSENFFFNGSPGLTRIRISLGSIEPIRRVDSYSWHHGDGSRAPQVYNLYASDGTAGGFNVNDPTSPGWSLVAAVNSTVAGGSAGNAGQQGVGIVDNAGALLGQYQHFLWDVASPNTFFSEFDIFQGELPVAPTIPEPATWPLCGMGALGLVARLRRARRRRT